MDRTNPPGFWSDSSSVPGYGLAMVAHEVGLEPSKIESDFYAVMRRLRSIALEVNNDKERFFERVGWKQIGSGGPHQPATALG